MHGNFSVIGRADARVLIASPVFSVSSASRVFPARCRTLFACALVLASWTPHAVAQSDFATRVIDYSPAPSQFVNHPLYNDPSRALGAPVGGGTVAADNSKLVTLGAFGGSITLGFDHTVLNDPRNPLGLDAIVFGNAVWVAGNANRRFAEAATIEISRDANANGVADDPWYLIPGSHLAAAPGPLTRFTQTWDDDIDDQSYPPFSVTWIPPGHAGVWTTSAFMLPDNPFSNGVAGILNNPLGLSSTVEGVWGYAELSPTLILGDTNANNAVDLPDMDPGDFYTIPDDPHAVGVGPGFGSSGGMGGGGDAFDIAWAIDPATGLVLPVPLDGFDFIRITTAARRIEPILGELSSEIGGVADVRPLTPPPHPADFNLDGVVNSQDLFDFLAGYFADDPFADLNLSGAITVQDLFDFLAMYFAGCA